MIDAKFAPLLLRWFDEHGRHDLPWQTPPTPYRVWVSEIMLQQTQVATVIPYYLRFLARFPDVVALAAAPIDEVLHLWSGLGYYARARNLHRAAQIIVDRHQAAVPADLHSLLKLPGIGRSTAAAILALSLEQRHAILDGNVKRVLARWFGIDGWPGEAAVHERLWQASEQVTPSARVRDYTQAIMDLGATVCTRSRPRCANCPLTAGCSARRDGRQRQLPGARPARAARRRRAVSWLVAEAAVGFYLLKRPARGIWGGLWGFPEFDLPDAARDAALELFDIDGRFVELPRVEHSFTHFDLSIAPLYVRVTGLKTAVQEATAVWYNARMPPTIGLAAPVAALIRHQASTGQSNTGQAADLPEATATQP